MKSSYKYKCGIDTMEIISPTHIDFSPPFFTHDTTRRIVGNSLTESYAYRFNPSYTPFTYNYSLTNCSSALDYAMKNTELNEPIINRIDFCFDDSSNNYRDLYKLNHLLFYLIAKKLNISNDYSSCGIQSPVQKTLRIQNSKLQAEFYNKAVEDPEGDIKCRLELRISRVKCATNDMASITLALKKWMDILASVTALKNKDLDMLLGDLNDEIMKRYNEDVQRGDYRKKDYDSMIQRYNKYIFTRRQLSQLLKRMEYKSYDSVASKYKEKHPGLEFFKTGELRAYVNHIKCTAEQFLQS